MEFKLNTRLLDIFCKSGMDLTRCPAGGEVLLLGGTTGEVEMKKTFALLHLLCGTEEEMKNTLAFLSIASLT